MSGKVADLPVRAGKAGDAPPQSGRCKCVSLRSAGSTSTLGHVPRLAAVGSYRTLSWRELHGVLRRDPLRYRIERQRGSHKKMVSDAGYPPLYLAFHDSAEIPPGLVRKILTRDVGLAEEEARELL